MKKVKSTEKHIKEVYANKLQVTTGSNLDKRVLADSINALEELKGKNSAHTQPNLWRIIMKSRITKLAAAAVIIIAALIGINQFGGSIDGTGVAFADIIRPLLTAETGSFKMTIDVIGSGLDWIDSKDERFQTIDVIFAGPGLTRWDTPTGEVLVANMNEGKVMILQPAKMEAGIMQVGPRGMIPRHNRFNKLLALKPLIEYALETEGESVEFLGEGEIDGVAVIGYHIAGPEHHGEITVWAEEETKLPIQIEQSMGTETAIVSNITYNIELDESLFSVKLPEGYSVPTPEDEDAQLDFVVKGTVTDAATGEPIAGAKVSDDGYGPKPYRCGITDSEGRYSYLTWPEEHNIVAEAPGYKPQRKGITGLFHVENEDEKVINFALEPE
ncbi:MAG: carboxypeptidase regulatory-like domain-containing protein [Planctomycetota bacterium]|jgi:outer membrane lipoprotein-sorting protein